MGGLGAEAAVSFQASWGGRCGCLTAAGGEGGGARWRRQRIKRL